MSGIKKHEVGFTLIEVMVAMSLILMAVTFTAPYIALQFRRIKAVRQEQEASYCTRRIIEYFQSVAPEIICQSSTRNGSLGNGYHTLNPGSAAAGIESDLLDFLGTESGNEDPCVRNGVSDSLAFRWKITPAQTGNPFLYCNDFGESGVYAQCVGKMVFKVTIRYNLPATARLGGSNADTDYREVSYTSSELVFDSAKIQDMVNNCGGSLVGSDCNSDNCTGL